MMHLPNAFIEILARDGTRLSAADEVALPPTAALNALRALKGSDVAVLGADLLRESNGALEYVVPGWFCDPLRDESGAMFSERSQREAMDFVGELVRLNDTKNLVVLVYSEAAWALARRT